MTTRLMLIAGILLAAIARSDPAAAQVALGIRAGVDNATTSYGEPKPFEVESLTRAYIGALGSLGLSHVFQLQLEVARSVKGFGIGGSGFDGAVHMTYLEFPLLAVVNVPTDWELAPRLLAGGAVSREISCKFDLLVGGAPTPDDCDAPENDFAGRRRTDLSLRFGGGVGMQFGPWSTFADVLYDFGLRDLDDGAATGQTAHSRTWIFSAGVTYAIAFR